MPGLGYSAHGQAAQVLAAHYAASKAGLHGLTHFLASRLAATGITVNAPTPALPAETRMLPGDPAQPRGRCPPAGSAPSQAAGLAAAILAKAYLTDQVISPGGGSYPRPASDGIDHGARTSWPGSR